MNKKFCHMLDNIDITDNRNINQSVATDDDDEHARFQDFYLISRLI